MGPRAQRAAMAPQLPIEYRRDRFGPIRSSPVCITYKGDWNRICTTITTARFTSASWPSALVGAGLLALYFPVFIAAYDQFGFQIECGTGFGTNLSQAAAASGGDYVGQCQTALMMRRLWSIPMAAIGSILPAILIFVAATLWGRESVFGEDQSI